MNLADQIAGQAAGAGMRGRLNKSSADLFTLDMPGRRELEARELAVPADPVPLLVVDKSVLTG